MRPRLILLAIVATLPALSMAQDSSAASQPVATQTPDSAALTAYFSAPPADRPRLAQPWRQATNLSAAEVQAWRDAIWRAYTVAEGPEQRTWRDDLAKQRVTAGGRVLAYSVHSIGEQPPSGWPVSITLDADDLRGQGLARVDTDFQGLHIFPHIAGDSTTAGQTQCDEVLLDRLVRELIGFGEADPNRVYLRGHAAGGDAVLRLGPNTADRWAAIAALGTAKGVDQVRVENLRNTPLFLLVGVPPGSANELADQWTAALRKLRDDANPDEYKYDIHAAAGDGSTAITSAPWLSTFTRDPVPRRIVWTQTTPACCDRYWLHLEAPEHDRELGELHTIDARAGGQLISLAMQGFRRITIRLDDRLIDLDRPLTITLNDEEVFTGKVPRLAATLVKTLEERGDPALMFCAELSFDVPRSAVAAHAPASAPATRETPPTPDYPPPVEPQLAAAVAAALRAADSNAGELVRALKEAPTEQRPGLYFLIANLPNRDLLKIKADFLLEDVRLAYDAWQHAPWSAQVSEQQFLQYILPFAHLNERRDNWRRDFYERFHEQAWRFQDPLDATKWLNDTINDTLNVHYHAHKRPKSDQSPYESIAAEYASCTGLSVLLANACRAVGIPARLTGVAQWLDASGNHTWVEVWGGPPDSSAGPILRRWYNVGGTGSDPRQGDWVNARCGAQVDPDKLLHRVYAACFRRSGLYFPLAWNLDIRYVPALNVTRFYTGPVEVEVDVPGGGSGQAVVYWNDEVLLTATGTGKVRLPLARGETVRLVVTGLGGARREQTLTP
jgi:transglutaminase-like putative cysteine protease